MRRRADWRRRALSIAALGVLAAAPMYAAGFGIFEQGTKAMGMAGAFTAQADDPSLLFHNAGGLAFVERHELAAGLTYIQGTKADFKGAGPFPGTGARAEQEKLSQPLPHAYWVQPINPVWKFGLGIYAPFGLTTEWKDPRNFPGRFLSTKAELRAIDLNPTLGWQITPRFGIGAGAIARFSDVQLNRDVPQVNPFTLGVADIASLKLDTGFNRGYGWNAGILHKWNNSFSWGLSYRSKVKVDYDGDARLTQNLTGNAQFDALIRSRLPFNRSLPVSTTIEFPDMASLGLAFALSPSLVLETDANWTGWSTFKDTPIDFTANDLPDTTIRSDWKDVYNYRAGLRWTTSATSQWRFGFVYDQTPQPEEAVSPLLPDADRDGLTLGYGYNGGLKVDLALMYLKFKERTRARSFPGEGPFNGTYNTQAVLLGATVSF
jgi:long-chain fatty acid transport protein